jgi:hypothetical protein
MASEEVKVRISKKDGKMSIDCNGFIGEGCSAIEEIETTLGTQTKHQDKDERYQYELQVPITQGLSL